MQNQDIKLSPFIKQRFFIFIRGLFACVISLILVGFILINPGTKIMSNENSLLPVLAVILILYGLLEFFDAFIIRKSSEY